MNKAEYEAKLNEFYEGTVIVKGRYINPNIVITHKCSKCCKKFFAKPLYLANRVQPHDCNSSGMGTGADYKKNKKTRKNAEDVGKRFTEMVWEDYTPKQIAKELDIAGHLVVWYFKEEGLI